MSTYDFAWGKLVNAMNHKTYAWCHHSTLELWKTQTWVFSFRLKSDVPLRSSLAIQLVSLLDLSPEMQSVSQPEYFLIFLQLREDPYLFLRVILAKKYWFVYETNNQKNRIYFLSLNYQNDHFWNIYSCIQMVISWWRQ